MLLDFNILSEKHKELAGVVHADGTARFQTIFNRKENPFIFDLLQYLDKEFRVKALINTSFNSKGEPIVHTEQDAINSAKIMKLDGVVLNGEYQTL
jgi:carbamoyltransferase